MSSIPVIRQISWLAVLLELGVMAGLIALAGIALDDFDERALFVGAGLYLLY